MYRFAEIFSNAGNPGNPRQRAVKRLLLCVVVCCCSAMQFILDIFATIMPAAAADQTFGCYILLQHIHIYYCCM